jgi:hypothetical protein
MDLRLFAAFVTSTIPAHGLYSRPNVHRHVADDLEIIRMIACGTDIWNRDDPVRADLIHWQPSILVGPIRSYIFVKYGNIFTNNQGTERANKDQNYAASHNRGEKTTSIRMGATGWLREQCAAPILGNKRVPFRGKKRTDHMIERIQFVQTKSQELSLSLGHDVFEARIKEIKEKLCVTFTSER